MQAVGATAPQQAVAIAKYAAATFSDFNGLLTGQASSGADVTFGGAQFLTVFYDINSPTYFKDGVSYAESAMGAPMNTMSVCTISSTGWDSSLLLQVGADRANGRPWLGDVCEIIIYGAVLSTSNRQAVEAYLKAKWGTP